MVPASRRLAASGKVSVEGLPNTPDAEVVIAVVYPPVTWATTSSPGAPPPDASSVSRPSACTMPATSYPMDSGSSPGSWPGAMCLASAGFMPQARTLMVTWPRPGSGTSASMLRSTSGPPKPAATHFRAVTICLPPPALGRARGPG